jgi:hypothetical protein
LAVNEERELARVLDGAKARQELPLTVSVFGDAGRDGLGECRLFAGEVVQRGGGLPPCVPISEAGDRGDQRGHPDEQAGVGGAQSSPHHSCARNPGIGRCRLRGKREHSVQCLWSLALSKRRTIALSTGNPVPDEGDTGAAQPWRGKYSPSMGRVSCLRCGALAQT